MVTTRIQWHELAHEARDLVEVHTGPIIEADTMSGGFNSEIAAVVRTQAGAYFVKGLRGDHPRVWTQQTEATINPYVRGIAPELLWHAQADGWNILGFECVEGRHADYSLNSVDLPKIVDTLSASRFPNVRTYRSNVPSNVYGATSMIRRPPNFSPAATFFTPTTTAAMYWLANAPTSSIGRGPLAVPVGSIPPTGWSG